MHYARWKKIFVTVGSTHTHKKKRSGSPTDMFAGTVTFWTYHLVSSPPQATKISSVDSFNLVIPNFGSIFGRVLTPKPENASLVAFLKFFGILTPHRFIFRPVSVCYVILICILLLFLIGSLFTCSLIYQ